MDSILNFLLKCNTNIPLNCFFLNDQIEIHTNNRILYKEFKQYFTPFFSISNTSKSLKSETIKIKIISIDEIEIFQLFRMIKGKELTKQYVGGPRKYLEWSTTIQDGYIISNSKLLHTVIIQPINKENQLIIIAPHVNIIQVSQKIIKNEILYKEILDNHLMLLNSAAVSKDNGEGILIIGSNCSDRTSVLFSMITKFRTSIISNRISFIKNNEENFSIHGIPNNTSISLKELRKYHDFIKNNKNITSIHKGKMNNEITSLNFNTSEITKIFDCNIHKKTRLNLIVFLKNKSHNKTKISELNNSEIRRELKNNILYPSMEKTSPWNDIIQVNIEHAYKRTMDYIEVISDNIKGLTLQIGTDYNEGIENLNDFL